MNEPYKVAENGFINLIQEQRGGLLEEELDAEIKRMVQLLRVRGGVGKISLTFTIKEVVEYDGCASVLDDIKVTHPKSKKKAELRFYDKDGGLISDMPEQVPLFAESKPSEHTPSNLKPSTSNITNLK